MHSVYHIDCQVIIMKSLENWLPLTCDHTMEVAEHRVKCRAQRGADHLLSVGCEGGAGDGGGSVACECDAVGTGCNIGGLFEGQKMGGDGE